MHLWPLLSLTRFYCLVQFMVVISVAGTSTLSSLLIIVNTHPPTQVVKVAAAILRDAEVGMDAYNHFNYIRNFTPKPMSTLEVNHVVYHSI